MTLCLRFQIWITKLCSWNLTHLPPAWHYRILHQQWIQWQLPTGLLELLPIPRRPWSHMAVDFVTNLPSSGGYNPILVAIDRFSKTNFGLPEDIVSEWGPQFTFQVWNEFCSLLGINDSLRSGYHPQSNNQMGWLNQEIDQYLWLYCSCEQQHWSEFPPWAKYAQNFLTCSSTGLTLFQCILGY